MNTTERFEKAVTKLYTAFHEGTLNAFTCEACAVGNILGHGHWFFHYPSDLEISDMLFKAPEENESGYSTLELMKVETLFLSEWPEYERRKTDANGRDKEIQFKGLCAVIEYLCELDGIPNVMDYSSLFEYNSDNTPKKELKEVLCSG